MNWVLRRFDSYHVHRNSTLKGVMSEEESELDRYTNEGGLHAMRTMQEGI